MLSRTRCHYHLPLSSKEMHRLSQRADQDMWDVNIEHPHQPIHIRITAMEPILCARNHQERVATTLLPMKSQQSSYYVEDVRTSTPSHIVAKGWIRTPEINSTGGDCREHRAVHMYLRFFQEGAGEVTIYMQHIPVAIMPSSKDFARAGGFRAQLRFNNNESVSIVSVDQHSMKPQTIIVSKSHLTVFPLSLQRESILNPDCPHPGSISQ
ncbi:hypothetical protein V8B97DRAFT_1320020 [Scleroderma yunnanense]